MKFFFLLISISLLASCKEEIPSWDKLTDAERQAIRERGEQNCLKDSNGRYQFFRNKSEQLYDVSYEYRLLRNHTWKIETKQGSTVSTSTSGSIAVWKLGTNAVYFLWKKTIDGTTTYKFIKIEADTNADMITDLQTRKCGTEKLNIGESAENASLKLLFPNQADPTDNVNYRIDIEKTYTLKYTELAFMGMFRETRIQKRIKRLDNTIASTETFTVELGPVTNPPLLETTYNSSTYNGAQFCILNKDANDSFPLKYDDNLNCSPLTSEFDPASELPI